MERVKLTNQRITAATCPPDQKSRTGKPINQIFLWDTDAPRLALRVTIKGAKAFIFEGKLNRQTIRMTIGDPANWTLEDARKEARRLQSLVDQGIDPREQKRTQQEDREAAKMEAKRAKEKTLEALMNLYADYCHDQGKQRHAAAVRSAVKCHLLEPSPDLAKTPAKDVTPRDIATLVRQVMDAGRTRTAGAFRSYLCAAYNCARKAPLSANVPAAFIDFNIDSNPVDPVPAIPVAARDRTLTKDELKSYLEALEGDSIIDNLLRLAVYAGGQRMAQIMRAEVKDFDPEQKILRLWDIKGKRQSPREHLVPLGPIGLSIVSSMADKAQERENPILFPSSNGKVFHIAQPGKRVAEISKAMEGEAFSLLDIRRTIETMLAGLGVGRDIRAQLLSHGISGVQAVHYDRHDYLKEKRAAIRKWEAHLKRLLSGDEGRKIVPIDEARRA